MGGKRWSITLGNAWTWLNRFQCFSTYRMLLGPEMTGYCIVYTYTQHLSYSHILLVNCNIPSSISVYFFNLMASGETSQIDPSLITAPEDLDPYLDTQTHPNSNGMCRYMFFSYQVQFAIYVMCIYIYTYICRYIYIYMSVYIWVYHIYECIIYMSVSYMYIPGTQMTCLLVGESSKK